MHHERTWQRLWSGGGGDEGILQRKVLHPFVFFSSLFLTWLQKKQSFRGCISSLPQETATKQPHHFKKIQGSFLILPEAGNVYLYIYSGHEYSKRKILLPWKRTLDTPFVYMKEKHKIKHKNWLSFEPNNRKESLWSIMGSGNGQKEENISTW